MDLRRLVLVHILASCLLSIFYVRMTLCTVSGASCGLQKMIDIAADYLLHLSYS